MRVLSGHELLPRLLPKVLHLMLNVRMHLKIELIHVVKHIWSAQDLSDLDHLIVIVGTPEEWFSLKNHSSQHAPSAPDVQLIIIVVHF